MVFVGYSCLYSFEESLRLYEELKKSMIPWNLFQLLEGEYRLSKNGTRIKTYLDKGERKSLRIQRMVLDRRIYFDLFPLFLIPNSILKMEEILPFGDKDSSIPKDKRKNSFFNYLIDQSLDKDFFSNFNIIGSKGRASFYQSKRQYKKYRTKKGIYNEKDEDYIYVIYFDYK